MAMSKMIRIALIRRNMSIKDLANILGYSGNNLSNKLKKDNFSENELHAISKILDCRYHSYFTFLEDDEKVK